MKFTITTIANLHIFDLDVSMLRCMKSGRGVRSTVQLRTHAL